MAALMVAQVELDALRRRTKELERFIQHHTQGAAMAPTPAAVATQSIKAKPKRRKMSAAARKRIGDAMRRRWAKTKAQPKP